MKERRSDAFFRCCNKADEDDKEDWKTTTENEKVRLEKNKRLNHEGEVSIFIYARQIEP
jgi:hypothetical protein